MSVLGAIAQIEIVSSRFRKDYHDQRVFLESHQRTGGEVTFICNTGEGVTEAVLRKHMKTRSSVSLRSFDLPDRFGFTFQGKPVESQVKRLINESPARDPEIWMVQQVAMLKLLPQYPAMDVSEVPLGEYAQAVARWISPLYT